LVGGRDPEESSIKCIIKKYAISCLRSLFWLSHFYSSPYYFTRDVAKLSYFIAVQGFGAFPQSYISAELTNNTDKWHNDVVHKHKC